MSRHHPKETTLAEFVAGTLDEGRSLVVAAHLHMCGECRDFVSAMEHAGGRMLDAIKPVELSDGARARTLDLLEQTRSAVRPSEGRLSASPLVWTSEKNELLGYRLRPWRWIAPGLRYRSVEVPVARDSQVFMLKAKPGLKLPSHSHTGTELTCVLAGAFIHEGGRYAAGDCDDADHDDGHTPVIDQGEDCVCVVAMQGQIQLKSALGRLIQPFIRI